MLYLCDCIQQNDYENSKHFYALLDNIVLVKLIEQSDADVNWNVPNTVVDWYVDTLKYMLYL